MSRYIWLFISFLLLSTLSTTYTSAMDGGYPPANGGYMPADVAQAPIPEQGEAVEGEVVGENGEVQVMQEDEATRELKTKQHVRNIVDSLLKINKQVEVRSDDPKVKRLMKEQNISKQIDRLRADIRDLEKTLNSHYTEIKKSSSNASAKNDEDENVNSTKQKSKAASTNRSGTNKYKSRSWKKVHSSSAKSSRSRSSDIHTVKNVIAPDTNSYLQRINQRNTPIVSAKKSSSKRVTPTYDYKVKCYGKNGSCSSPKTAPVTPPQTSTSNTVKKVDYFNPDCGTRSCK